MLDILQLCEDTGNSYKKVTNAEFQGPCPYCGGNDRFSIILAKDHFVCRSCKKAGDSMFFQMDYHQMGYLDACVSLGRDPNIKYKSLNIHNGPYHSALVPWVPRQITLPPKAWQEKAGIILMNAYKYLLSGAGKGHREWLNARGISNATIKQARFGWITRSLTFDRKAWGLDATNEDGTSKKDVWLPEGLIIPYFQGNLPVRLRIRQSKPIGTDRYIIVGGSSTGFLVHSKHAGGDINPSLKTLVCESELDGWLLHQEIGDLINIMSIGSAQTRPGDDIASVLAGPALVTLLDNDLAGITEQKWWSKQYPGCKNWLMPAGKDPGEGFALGVNIRAWFLKKAGSVADLSTKLDQNVWVPESKPVLPATVSFAPPVSKPIQKPAQKMPTSRSLCRHNRPCLSFNSETCLVAKTNVYNMEKCPKDQWYLHHDNEYISTIVLGFEYGKKRRQKRE